VSTTTFRNQQFDWFTLTVFSSSTRGLFLSLSRHRPQHVSLVPGHPSGGGTPCYHHTAPPPDTAIARAQHTSSSWGHQHHSKLHDRPKVVPPKSALVQIIRHKKCWYTVCVSSCVSSNHQRDWCMAMVSFVRTSLHTSLNKWHLSKTGYFLEPLLHQWS